MLYCAVGVNFTAASRPDLGITCWELCPVVTMNLVVTIFIWEEMVVSECTVGVLTGSDPRSVVNWSVEMSA